MMNERKRSSVWAKKERKEKYFKIKWSKFWEFFISSTFFPNQTLFLRKKSRFQLKNFSELPILFPLTILKKSLNMPCRIEHGRRVELGFWLKNWLRLVSSSKKCLQIKKIRWIKSQHTHPYAASKISTNDYR